MENIITVRQAEYESYPKKTRRLLYLRLEQNILEASNKEEKYIKHKREWAEQATSANEKEIFEIEADYQEERLGNIFQVGELLQSGGEKNFAKAEWLYNEGKFRTKEEKDTLEELLFITSPAFEKRLNKQNKKESKWIWLLCLTPYVVPFLLLCIKSCFDGSQFTWFVYLCTNCFFVMPFILMLTPLWVINGINLGLTLGKVKPYINPYEDYLCDKFGIKRTGRKIADTIVQGVIVSGAAHVVRKVFR